MGEGVTIGLDGTGRADVVGSAMARLAGGTEPIDLPKTGFAVWLPTYDLLHVEGTPRHRWLPQPGNRRVTDTGNGEDTALEAAIARIAQQSSATVP